MTEHAGTSPFNLMFGRDARYNFQPMAAIAGPSQEGHLETDASPTPDADYSVHNFSCMHACDVYIMQYYMCSIVYKIACMILYFETAWCVR